MPTDLTIAAVFGLHVVLGAIVVLSAYAAGSRGLVAGVLTGLVLGGAVILGDLTVGQDLLTVTVAEMKQLTIVAITGGALGVVPTALVFEPGEPDSTDAQPDPTTYTNR